VACCAFAAFLIAQLYLAVTTTRARLFGSAACEGQQRRWRWLAYTPRRAVVALVLCFAAGGVAYAAGRIEQHDRLEHGLSRVAMLFCHRGL
jgi:hypothetical protein